MLWLVFASQQQNFPYPTASGKQPKVMKSVLWCLQQVINATQMLECAATAVYMLQCTI